MSNTIRHKIIGKCNSGVMDWEDAPIPVLKWADRVNWGGVHYTRLRNRKINLSIINFETGLLFDAVKFKKVRFKRLHGKLLG